MLITSGNRILKETTNDDRLDKDNKNRFKFVKLMHDHLKVTLNKHDEKFGFKIDNIFWEEKKKIKVEMVSKNQAQLFS